MKKYLAMLLIVLIAASSFGATRKYKYNDRTEFSAQPWYLRVMMGEFPDFTTIDKFGVNPTITAATDPEDVWEYGGVYTFSDTADITSISSSSANDTTQTIRIYGLDDDGVNTIQDVSLNGQSIVTLSTPLWRVYRMENNGAVDIAGTVYCYKDTFQTAGVPDTASHVRAIINDGNNQTLMSVYTIPLGYVGFLVHGQAGLSFTGGVAAGTQTAVMQYRSRRYCGVFKVKKQISLVTAGSSNFFEDRPFPDPIPALTDIKIYVANVSAEIGVWATLSIMLVDEDYFNSSYLTAIGQPTSK